LRVQAKQSRRCVPGKRRPAFHSTRSNMAEIAVLLDTEATGLSPGERLVVPQAARVETDVAADRAHVAQQGRGDSASSFRQHWVALPQHVRTLARTVARACADSYACSGP